eukprot:TRINITY_DN40122_c0_g1_i1.p1 TRINITY_DN40122_c0_g1~~TRINITY_DN40122_c0_g1_i1.p1  ORF type:complete len:372 (+),score=96.95 TRINITY_DN40122_c0_g1_i1:59-1174(+)
MPLVPDVNLLRDDKGYYPAPAGTASHEWCAKHGKKRSMTCLMVEEADTYVCKPQDECRSLNRETKECWKHKKHRLVRHLQPHVADDGTVVMVCTADSECKAGPSGVGVASYSQPAVPAVPDNSWLVYQQQQQAYQNYVQQAWASYHQSAAAAAAVPVTPAPPPPMAGQPLPAGRGAAWGDPANGLPVPDDAPPPWQSRKGQVPPPPAPPEAAPEVSQSPPRAENRSPSPERFTEADRMASRVTRAGDTVKAEQPGEQTSCDACGRDDIPAGAWVFVSGDGAVQYCDSCTSAVAGSCGRCSAELLLGHDWYHRRGTATDLCAEHWQGLSEVERTAFAPVHSVADLHEERTEYLRETAQPPPMLQPPPPPPPS